MERQRRQQEDSFLRGTVASDLGAPGKRSRTQGLRAAPAQAAPEAEADPTPGGLPFLNVQLRAAGQEGAATGASEEAQPDPAVARARHLELAALLEGGDTESPERKDALAGQIARPDVPAAPDHGAVENQDSVFDEGLDDGLDEGPVDDGAEEGQEREEEEEEQEEEEEEQEEEQEESSDETGEQSEGEGTEDDPIEYVHKEQGPSGGTDEIDAESRTDLPPQTTDPQLADPKKTTPSTTAPSTTTPSTTTPSTTTPKPTTPSTTTPSTTPSAPPTTTSKGTVKPPPTTAQDTGKTGGKTSGVVEHTPSTQPVAPPSAKAFRDQFAANFPQIRSAFPENVETLFSAAQRALLVKFWQDKKLPPAFFTANDSPALTRSLKILLAGSLHAMDQTLSKKRAYRKVRGQNRWVPIRKRGKYVYQREVRAENCGEWAQKVWEYAGIRTPRGAKKLKGRKAKRDYYVGKGGWKRGSRKGWYAAKDYEKQYRSQLHSVPPRDFAAIKPGDWIMVKWKKTAGGNNHSVIFIKWITGNANSKRRRAMVMDQHDNRIGGGDIGTAKKPRTLPLTCLTSRPPYVYAIMSPK